ncbi:MAG: LysR family transcriptional regulator [Pseudomonadota bacterium]
MDWDKLRFFLELARTGKLTDAGRRLQVDHTTVSRNIQSLESALGTTLFARAVGGMTLTEAGRKLLPHAEAMEAASLRAGGAVGAAGPGAGPADPLTGTVRIGATEGFGTAVLAPRLALFAAQHPGLTIDLIAVSKIVNISRREADIVVALERPTRGPFLVTQLCEYSLHLYAAPGYLVAQGTPASLDDLRRHRFIGYVDDLVFSKQLQYLGELGLPLDFSLRSTSLVAQQQAAAAGAGMAVLPAFLAGTDPRLVRVLPEQVRFRRKFWMSMPAEVKHLARLQGCWDQLRGIARDSAGLLMQP